MDFARADAKVLSRQAYQPVRSAPTTYRALQALSDSPWANGGYGKSLLDVSAIIPSVTIEGGD